MIEVKWLYTKNKHIQLHFKYTSEESEAQNNQYNISHAGMWSGGHMWFALLLGSPNEYAQECCIGTCFQQVDKKMFMPYCVTGIPSDS